MRNLFDEYCVRITNEYNELGHKLGWSFLCTPRATLNKNSSIALLTMNPGGKGYAPSVKSYEDGNVYLNEIWDKNKGFEPIQLQIQALFRHLSKEIPYYNNRHKTLMEESLVSYFIPFRSKSIKKLIEPYKSRVFAYNLWKNILQNVDLKLIICIDKTTFHNINLIYKNEYEYTLLQHETMSSGWGRTNLEFNKLKNNNKQIVIARFPHLSRYKLFNRKASEQQLVGFIKRITSVFK